MILLKFLVAAPLFAIAMTVHAQDLLLTKRNRTKTIEIGKVISFKTANPKGIYDKRNYASARGKLVSVDPDSITLILFSQAYRIDENRELRSRELKSFVDDSTRIEKAYAKSSIKRLVVWGDSEKAIKQRKSWGKFGGSLAFIGVTTEWIATTVDDNDTRHAMTLAALGALVVGTTILVIATPKILKTSNDLRKNKNKIYWKIQ